MFAHHSRLLSEKHDPWGETLFFVNSENYRLKSWKEHTLPKFQHLAAPLSMKASREGKITPSDTWVKGDYLVSQDRDMILLMDKILHHQGRWISHYLRGFHHLRWCRILSINRMIHSFSAFKMILLIRSKSPKTASTWIISYQRYYCWVLLVPIYNKDCDSHHENNKNNCWWFRNPAAYWTIHYDLYPPHPLVRRCRVSVLPLVCFGANFFLTNVKWAAWSLYPDLILFRLEVMRSQVGAVSWVCWMVWGPRVQVMVVDFNQERMKVKRATIFSGLRMMK